MSPLRRDFFPIFFSAALLFFLTAAPALLHAQDADLFEPAPAWSGKKALFTIFYNGESTGEMHPCPT